MGLMKRCVPEVMMACVFDILRDAGAHGRAEFTYTGTLSVPLVFAERAAWTLMG